ncbi:hypothetical protein ACLB2K_022649 [Fragaria x ananassa]
MDSAAPECPPPPSGELDPPPADFSASRSGGGGAKYKLMSPAKLPISRSPCLTIPPGLTPTSFLESPVLLSNMKAEPSPTTGSFLNPKMVYGTASSTYSGTMVCSNERNSGSFEFKPHSRLNMVTTDYDHHSNEQAVQVQGQGQGQHQSQSFVSPPLLKSEMAGSSNQSILLAPVHMVSSGPSAHVEGDADDTSQRGNLNSGVQTSQLDLKGSSPSVSSDDGYNWRKYGQKHVKGSEFPRSYYKCTHPNCEVKKLFERSHEGHITEIIYKGTHDHPKPQPSRRYNTGAAMMNVQEERSDKALSLTGRDDKSSSMYGQMSNTNEPSSTPELSPVRGNDGSGEGTGSLATRILDEVDDEDPFSKRRRMDVGGIDVTPIVKPIREPRVVVQTLSEVDILDDGYRWRKYGQKVVRGNPNPRSYYKCTNAGCPVRKHVERASHDPKAVITTYEGKHNHDVPTARTSSHDTSGPTTVNAPSRIRTEENDTISLDLGVGMSSASENRSNNHLQMHSELAERQTHPSSNFKAAPSYYGVLNSGMNQYGSRESPSESRNIEIPPLNHSSYPYPQNLGRVLTGP